MWEYDLKRLLGESEFWKKVKILWWTVLQETKMDGPLGVGYNLNKNAVPEIHKCFVGRCQSGCLTRESREGSGNLGWDT